MPQLYADPSNITDTHFRIVGQEAHHLISVLRKQINDEIDFFDGRGGQYKGRLSRLDLPARIAEGIILDRKDGRPSNYALTLFQGLPKGAKVDYVLEKATELGAAEIVFFLSAKNPIKIDDQQRSQKTIRWKRLVHASAKQCNRPTIPEVHVVTQLSALPEQLANGFSVLLWEKEQTQTLKSVLRAGNVPAGRVNVVVGPEAGFLTGEADRLIAAGARPITLGSLILRTETAGLAALSMINYELNMK